MTRAWSDSEGPTKRGNSGSSSTFRSPLSQEGVAEQTPPTGFPTRSEETRPIEATPVNTTPVSTWGEWGPGWADGCFQEGQFLLNKYQVVRKLGQGGMGAVWLVRHTALDVERVLKVIISGISFDPKLRGRFQREARAMARFSHPNAVGVHDADARPNSPVAFIEMDYVAGQSLKALLEPGVPMPLDWVGRILDQFCNVLQLAHQRGIVHRDLKPANLMLEDGHEPGHEVLKVLDFGIAKILEPEGHSNDESLTQEGFILGTPRYISPEQVAGDTTAMDARSDLYAVGLILYELLTGYAPFEGPAYRLCRDHLHTPPPPFAQRNPKVKVPPEVEAVVLRCLEKDPNHRPQSARELGEEFRRVTRPKPEPPPPHPHPHPRHRRWLVPVLAVLVAVLGGAVWALWPRTVLRVVPPSLTLQPGDETGQSVVVFAPTSAPLESVKGPDGIVVHRDSATNFRLTADLNARPGHRTLDFRSGSGERARKVSLSIEIAPPEVSLPDPSKFTSSPDAQLVRYAGRNYPDRIARVLDDGTHVEFLLIPRKRGREVVEVFYIMEDKVWNSLYERFDAAGGGPVPWPRGPSNPDWPRLPVMMISQDQAAAFAQWLAGSDANLPTRAQWDLAAGLSDENPRTGPIAREPTEVADGRELKSGPLPVGSASGDRSSSGLHDLAGNGMEWTRDQEFSYPVIRGRSFDESLDKSPPLTFEELQNAAVMEPKPDPRIGFRVVIEIRP